MNAITFAEAGEWETARSMIPETSQSKLAKSAEQTFMAAAFAEAGEWETARSMMPQTFQSKFAQFFEQTFMAVAFAEESMHDEAHRIIGKTSQPTNRAENFLNSVGLRGVRMTYGILQEEAIQ